MKITKGKVILALLVLLILIQFIRIDKSNPTSDPSQDFFAVAKVDQEMSTMIKNACYDCHSNQTTYPWYTNVAPVSFWIQNHIKGARKKLNFNEWGSYEAGRQKHQLEECVDAVETKWMPLNSYTWLHPEAKLSAEDRQKLIAFFKSMP